MRLFVAVALDPVARVRVGLEQRRVADVLGRDAQVVRFVHPQQLHLTLVFLGERDETTATALARTMDGEVNQAPYDITFEGLGVFPARGAPRVIWLGLSRGAAETVALRRAIGARLSAIDRRTDFASPYTPHLTLGRFREGRSMYRRVLDSRTAPVATIHVASATLFHSRLTSDGPTYTALAHTALV